MESSTDLCSLLRHNGRHDLADLLANAHVDFDVYNEVFDLRSDAEFDLAHAIVYATASAVSSLRSLSQDDGDVLVRAMQDIWPCDSSGGMSIQDVHFRIDRASLKVQPLTLFEPTTGWQRFIRTMNELRERLATATSEEDFQQLGHLSRETLISLAQGVFDPSYHSPSDSQVSSSDAKGMMDRYLAVECSGSSNEEVRRCVRSAYDLANAVQHDRNATYRQAALCVQAVFNVVGLIEIISGKRDAEAQQSSVA